MRNAEAIQNLVSGFVAYSFLLWTACLRHDKGSLPIKTLGSVSPASQALIQSLICMPRAPQLGSGEEIFAYVFAKQQPVIAR